MERSIVFIFLIVFLLVPNFVSQNGLELNDQLTRYPASETTDSCLNAVQDIISKKIKTDEALTENSVKSFWAKRDGNYLGGFQYILARNIAKKIKIALMDINKNFRPVYYLNVDEASYAKIFRYLDLHGKNNVDDVLQEATSLEEEVNGWLAKYKNFSQEMTDIVTESVVNTQYIKKLKDLKEDKNLTYPFQVELTFYTEGRSEIFRDYISEKNDFNQTIFKLQGRNKKIFGNFFRGPGSLTQRDIEQAILSERLKYLESEMRDRIANAPESESLFREILAKLVVSNRDKELRPTMQSATKLEFQEMDAEYKALFVDVQNGVTTMNDYALSIVNNLTPRERKKLGIDDINEWANAFKMGRKGIIYGALGTVGTGTGGLILSFWNAYNYDKDSKFNIINAADENEFGNKLKAYLKNEFDMDLLARLEKKNDSEMTLKDYDKNNKKERDLVNMVNEIIKQRKEYKKDETTLQEIEKKLTDTLDSFKDPVPTIPLIPGIPGGLIIPGIPPIPPIPTPPH